MTDECVFTTNECALMKNTHSKMTDECVFFYDLKVVSIDCVNCLGQFIKDHSLNEAETFRGGNYIKFLFLGFYLFG